MPILLKEGGRAAALEISVLEDGEPVFLDLPVLLEKHKIQICI